MTRIVRTLLLAAAIVTAVGACTTTVVCPELPRPTVTIPPLVLATPRSYFGTPQPAIGLPGDARIIPRCEEDAVLVGTGQFADGRWTSYTCGPSGDGPFHGPIPITPTFRPAP